MDGLAESLRGTCAKCRHRFRDGGELVCRRNPPQVTIIMAPLPPPRVGQVAPMSVCAFPIVNKDMWCGEFSMSSSMADA